MNLEVKKREKLGRKSKKLRKEGLIPAELFGRGFDNIHISVPEKKFIKLYKDAGQNTIIDVDIDEEKKPVPALIYDVQFHPISRKPLAIDFYRIREDEKITTSIPIKYVGESPIEKEEDLIIVKVLNEIDIESLPREIPQEIEIDLSQLQEKDDMIHISDVNFPEGVEVQLEPDTVVVSITEKEEEEEEEVSPIMPGELGDLGDLDEGEMPLGEDELTEEATSGESEDTEGDEPEL